MDQPMPNESPQASDLPSNADATTLDPGAARSPLATTHTARPEVSGYEILGELGRGGMGVVYRARQTQLNRLVALKMILTGTHAGETDLARFKAEAEAIARLQHPHIVQIHEIGEHAGLPYFSLDFCPGGNLEKKLAGTPLPAREAAALVEELARAMHAAHQKGVVHRDLKPANVLLADDGTPKISDFGLAKMLGEAGQTQSGAILGTPSYMAPEQAEGKGKAVGPAADIYALGAILYECLTGRPPFRAATPLDTLVQVVSQEPVPPVQLNAEVPRDLETICLKCLRKEASKRYGDSEELAEDLRRFQTGEVIRARPVGRWEKAGKWVRRNPVVAGLAAAVVMALLAGTGVSTYFAFDAAEQARQAQRNEEKAKKNAADLTNANTELEQSRDNLERTLARSLLSPLGLKAGEPLTDPEIDALWQLANSREERLRYRFVKEGLRQTVTTRQLKNRAEAALHAAVGLQEKRRFQVEQLLVQRLQDPTLTTEQQADVALAATRLGGLTPQAARRVSSALLQAMDKTDDPFALGSMAQDLAAVAARLEPKEAVQFAAALVQAMAKTTDPYHLRELARGLAAVAAHLEPKDANRLCALAATRVQATTQTTNFFQLSFVAQVQGAVAAHLEPQQASRLCAPIATALAQALAKTTDRDALLNLAEGLVAVAARLKPKEAVQTAGTLARAMAKTKTPEALDVLAHGLVAVAARLEPEEANRCCAPAAATLTQALVKTADPDALEMLAEGLAAVAAHLGPKETRPAARALAKALSKLTDPSAMNNMAQGLAALAGRLEAKEANHLCSPVAAALARAMTKTTNPEALDNLAQGLGAVAVRLEPKEAGQAAADLAQALALVVAKTPRPYGHGYLAEALGAVAARLEPKEANRLCVPAAAALARILAKSADPPDLYWLARGLGAVAVRLEPPQASRFCARAAAALAQAIGQNTRPPALRGLARHLPAVAARLEPRQADGFCAFAAAALAQAMAKTSDAPDPLPLAEDLAAVLTIIDSPEKSRRVAAAAGFVAFLAGTSQPLWSLPVLGPALKPLPCRFSTQELVDLLKQPTCIGTARRVILDQLEHRYHQKFADHWDFVRYAEKQKLGLDFTSPPQRPAWPAKIK
jgi:hypothetical protein